MMINVIVIFAFLAGVIYLQIFLSKKASKVDGLILPVISFLFSLFVALSTPTRVTTSLSVNGIVNHVETSPVEGALGQIIMLLFLGNISTIVLVMIYASYRQKNATKTETKQSQIGNQAKR